MLRPGVLDTVMDKKVRCLHTCMLHASVLSGSLWLLW